MSASTIVITPRQFWESRELHATLCLILREVLSQWPIDVPATFTSIRRTKEEDEALGGSGVHRVGPPWRAFDLGTVARGITQERADSIADYVNQRWIYDPARPQMQVAISRPHGSGPHLHCQACDATVRREETA
jgi:hypothetical protein